SSARPDSRLMPNPSHIVRVRPSRRKGAPAVAPRKIHRSIAMLTPATIARPSVWRNRIVGKPKTDGHSRMKTLSAFSSTAVSASIIAAQRSRRPKFAPAISALPPSTAVGPRAAAGLRAALAAPSAAAAALPTASLRHLRSGSARLGETDRDRLLAARDLAARAPAAQRAALALAHDLLDLLRCLLAVLPCHGSS